jgi:GTP-binding protein Era
MPRAGIVTVVGKPNAGKSTLLNRIVGQKLAITSPKPQSTRDRVVGIHSTADTQMVVLDTPGLLEPRYALHAAMRGTAMTALRDADVVLYLADATEGDPPSLETVAALTEKERPRAPVLLVLNKADALSPEQRAGMRERHPDALLISALDGDGVDDLLTVAAARLPESPFLYPEDEISTQTLRFFAAELVRETALEQLDDEVPYSVACEIEEFRESRSPVYIRAVLHVERDSQKRILIGAKGARIREIGRAARVKIEALLEAQVYLDLWVKVLPNWRRDHRALRRLGYHLPPDSDA